MSTPPRSKTMPPMDLERLGAQMEASRHQLNLSAREVADTVDISPAYLRVLEKGANPKTKKPSRPSVDVLIRLAKVLDAEPVDFLELAGYPKDLAAGDVAVPARGALTEPVEQIEADAHRFEERGPFLRFEIERRLNNFARELRSLSLGTLLCKPEEEPFLTKLAVQRFCEQHLRAVSFHDETWWTSDDGDAYLRVHEELPKEVDMTRIFLANMDRLAQLRPAIERHVEVGIETYIIPQRTVPQHLWRDLVIYDDKLLRRALSDEFEAPGKSAEFTDNLMHVEQALSDFHLLLDIAKANHYQSDRVLSEIPPSP